MTTLLVENRCDGGHYNCTPPKECCIQGCCFLLTASVHKPIVSAGSFFSPLFLGHWYFWLAVTATIIGILCACSLWKKHSQNSLCCRDSGRDERVSEPDSNGSCYAPPQYSRCNSFHQAPPPYLEVTTKPDLYPLVISYNAEPAVKNNPSTGYLMVQYFRNFIVRPVGNLSATSTVDSLSSSFMCSAVNEANTIVPPPYSSTGSLEEVLTDNPGSSEGDGSVRHLPRSSSSASNTSGFVQTQRSPSVHSQIAVQASSAAPPVLPKPLIRDNPLNKLATNVNTPPVPNEVDNVKQEENRKTQPIAETSGRRLRKLNIRKLSKDRSQDSESLEEDHNFSDLLNLSVCVPSSVVHLENPIHSNPLLQEMHYSVTNSMTGSDISSLANLGTPDSPPRATSPTVEMKELLDKIQQLPQQKSPVPIQQKQPEVRSRNYFHKMKAKTLYMPLYDSSGCKAKNTTMFTRKWLSRSAPNTPCGNFVPNFPTHKNASKEGKSMLTDENPLLKEQEESEEDNREEGS